MAFHTDGSILHESGVNASMCVCQQASILKLNIFQLMCYMEVSIQLVLSTCFYLSTSNFENTVRLLSKYLSLALFHQLHFSNVY